MMLLDTCAWIWWATDPDKLSPAAKKGIEDHLLEGGELLISAISAWEIAMLVSKGRIELRISATEFVKRTISKSQFRFVDISPAIGLAAAELDPIHKDPADRIVIATALQLEAFVVTSDGKFPKYNGLKVLW